MARDNDPAVFRWTTRSCYEVRWSTFHPGGRGARDMGGSWVIVVDIGKRPWLRYRSDFEHRALDVMNQSITPDNASKELLKPNWPPASATQAIPSRHELPTSAVPRTDERYRHQRNALLPMCKLSASRKVKRLCVARTPNPALVIDAIR